MFPAKKDTHLSPTQTQGQEAETLALHWLEPKGYRLLAANHRTPMGEVDLILEQKETIVFVEVRERKSTSFGTPAETVTRKKQARIAKAALMFLKAKGLTRRPLRFDVVSVQSGTISHIENAFAPPGYTL
ncbi:MAG: YraN family protein [Elusimicrobia bacterium]|nr:YraN family protein [Elusimicrobiota bacterium]